MLTARQRLARILGAFLHGFLVVVVAITPFDPDFQANLVIAAWGGSISCLFQIKKLVDEYGRKRKQR